MIAARQGVLINITSTRGVYRWPLMSAYAASKAALVKLTETLAEETRPHGVSVFSVDPGMLPIGLTEIARQRRHRSGHPRGTCPEWIEATSWRPGKAPTPARAASLIVALASGSADRLSGRHLTVADEVDALLGRIDRIEREDLHTLRLRRP